MFLLVFVCVVCFSVFDIRPEHEYISKILDRKNQSSSTVADLAAQFGKGLNLYRSGNFGLAKVEFENCLKIVATDGPAQTYVQRCQSYIDNPPANDWDGVFTLTEKGH